MRIKVNRKTRWMFPVLIVGIVLSFVIFIGISLLGEFLLAPKEYLFYEMNAIATIGVIWLVVPPVVLVCCLLATKIFKMNLKDIGNLNDIVYVWNRIGKWRFIAITIWIISLYCCVVSVTYVTEDTLVYHSPLHPSGITYEYSDIEEITTGFGDKIFSIFEYEKKGNFFYQIRLDGKTITFSVPSVNEDIERYEDSYLELEEFDQALVRLDIPKNSDSKGYQNCDLDKQYIERFLRIIENVEYVEEIKKNN